MQLTMILFVPVQWIIFSGLSSIALAELNFFPFVTEDRSWMEPINVVGTNLFPMMNYYDSKMNFSM